MILTYVMYSDERTTILVKYDDVLKSIIWVRYSSKNYDKIDIEVSLQEDERWMCKIPDNEFCARVLNFLKKWMIKVNLCGVSRLIPYLVECTNFYNYQKRLIRNVVYATNLVGYQDYYRYLGYGYIEFDKKTRSKTGFLFIQNTSFCNGEYCFSGDINMFKSLLIVVNSLDAINIRARYAKNISGTQAWYKLLDDDRFVFFNNVELKDFKQDTKFLGIDSIIE